ncbi:MAG TPA: hypothetical protein VF384_08305 [Planctomycetota bacterium]
MPRSSCVDPVRRCLVVSLLVGSIAAQCANTWQPSGGFAGVSGTVKAMTMWDPDGAGPQFPQLVVGGAFTLAGDVPVNHIAAWDPQSGSWTPLGSGVGTSIFPPPPNSVVVSALAVMPNGDLIAGGRFPLAGGSTVNNIARWNGTSWSGLALGADADVTALAALPNGDLVATGLFSTVGGVAANGIARWNGASWSPLGAGITGTAFALAVLPSGDLIVGGYLSSAGATPVNNIARWNGVAWSPLGTGLDAGVGALVVMANGDLIAGGGFTSAGGVSAARVARWDGVNWSPLGLGIGGGTMFVSGLSALPGGGLIACGGFSSAGGLPASNVAQWNGTAWLPLSSGLPGSCAAAVSLPNGDFVVAGEFTSLGAAAAHRLARWNGSIWAPLGPAYAGWDAAPLAFALANGELVAGGAFTVAEGVPCNHVARRSGSTWTPLGLGTNGPVVSLAVMPNGDVIVAGGFSTAGGVAADGIARWDGASWSSLGGGFPVPPGTFLLGVFIVAGAPNGDVYAVGRLQQLNLVYDSVVRWTGTSWASVPAPHVSLWALSVLTLLVTPTGDVYLGGAMAYSPNGAVVRLVGNSWVPVGLFDGWVRCLAMLPGGDIVAGGRFWSSLLGGPALSCLARWNGASWFPLGGGASDAVYALTVLPNGDLVAGGGFASPTPNIARWNGASWLPMGGGTNGIVQAVRFDPEGGVIAGGGFTSAGGVASPNCARFITNCSTAASTYATGCPSSAGMAQWTISSGPWVGSTYRAICSGLPSQAFAVDVIGLTTNPLSLAALLPQGQPGCTLVPDLQILTGRVITNGRAESELAIPNVPWIAGIPFFHQMVPFEFAAAMGLVAVTASDTLRLTIGVF